MAGVPISSTLMHYFNAVEFDDLNNDDKTFFLHALQKSGLRTLPDLQMAFSAGSVEREREVVGLGTELAEKVGGTFEVDVCCI